MIGTYPIAVGKLYDEYEIVRGLNLPRLHRLLGDAKLRHPDGDSDERVEAFEKMTKGADLEACLLDRYEV